MKTQALQLPACLTIGQRTMKTVSPHPALHQESEFIIQVTLDGSNSDLSKFSISQSKTAVPFFNSIKLSKFTPYLENFRSLEVLFLSNQDLGPVIHISLFFTLHLSKSGRLYTPIKRVIITLFTWIAVNTGGWLGLVN